MAFHHPQPVYPTHILIVPKKAIANLSALQPADDRFLAEVFSTVQKLVAELGLGEAGYRLVVNGGEYQEVPLLHFHLIAGGEVGR